MAHEQRHPDASASPGRRRVALRWLAWKCMRITILAFLGIVALAMIFEERLIFFPTRYPQGNWNPSGLTFEDAWFHAADGTRLHGWYVEHDRPQAVVLIAHGNAGNLSDRAEMLRLLRDQLDVAVMIFDYRGYGRSDGRPDEEGVLADARAARAWLAKRTGLAETAVVLLGRSIGGAVMVDLAARDGARALILESTFTSLPEVAARHYPFLPVRRLMRTRLESIAKIGNYSGPLLMSHGKSDTVVPYSLGKKLFEAANEPKQFITVDGDHNDFPSDGYYQAFSEFLDTLQ